MFWFLYAVATPSPPPLALLTAQQELLKIYVSICIIYAIFTCFSNQKSV